MHKWRFVALVVLVLACGSVVFAAVGLQAKVTPPGPLKAGDTFTISARLDDPQGTVKTLASTIREYPDLTVPLKQGDDGVWTFTFTLTPEFQNGSYTFDLVARDVQGWRVPLAPGSTRSVRYTIGRQVPVKAPAAPEFRPNLVSVRATTGAGKPILIRHPYRGLAGWYKGMLHTHTTNSDGRTPAPVLIGKYLADGFQWLMIADHEVVSRETASETGQPIVRIFGRERATRQGDMVCINFTDPTQSPDGQDTINLVTAKGGMVMLAHPEDEDVGYTAAEIDGLRGMALIEIANGHMDATRTWDYLLSKGRYAWGAASDDFHGRPDSPLPGCAVVVNASTCTPAALLDSLRAGNFYATRGPSLSFALHGASLRVQADAPGEFAFRGPGGLRLAITGSNATNAAVYDFRGDERYVRVEFTRASDGRRAWSQPFFVSPGR